MNVKLGNSPTVVRPNTCNLMEKWWIFSYISERNNDYSDTLDFRRGWVGEVGVVTCFVLKVPDYESAMLIYLCICICICIRSYDTGRSFDPIYMKFTSLVRVHSWVNPIVFEIIGPIEPQIWGKICPQNRFFGFRSNGIGVFEKKTWILYLVPHLPKKRLYSFLSSEPPFPEKCWRPPK